MLDRPATRTLIFPSNPALGDRFGSWIWTGEKWVCGGGGAGGGGGASVSVGPTSPAGASDGDLWFDDAGLRLYVRTQGTWIVANPDGGSADGGGGWPAMGVTDGSDAQAGEVGEHLESQITTQNLTLNMSGSPLLGPLNLPAGDWDVAWQVSVLNRASTWMVAEAWLALTPSVITSTTVYPRVTLQGSFTSDSTVYACGHLSSFSRVKSTVQTLCQVHIRHPLGYPPNTQVTVENGFICARRMR